MPRPADHWPVYFAKRPLKAKMVNYKAGDLFKMQDVGYIRALGPGFGVANSRDLPFAELDYVQILDVGTRPMATAIVSQGLTLNKAKQLLGGLDG